MAKPPVNLRKDVSIGLFTTRPLWEPELGVALLETLCRTAPELCPEKYGYFEPLRSVFDTQDIARAMDAWRGSFLWKRSRPLSSGSVWSSFPSGAKHSHVALGCSSRGTEPGRVIRLLREWALLLTPDLAHLHALADGDIRRAMETETDIWGRSQLDSIFITTHTLNKFLPDIYWATVFGPPYVKHFGLDRLLSAPAAVVEQLDTELVYVQLTADMEDVRRDWDAFEQVRQAMKAHLDADAFFDPRLGRSHRYSVPEFRFGLPDRPRN
jgi:hypothetical protein